MTTDKALLWTDGRYFLQAAQQLDPTCWTLMKDRLPETPSIEEWLANNIDAGKQVGFDPYLISLSEFKRINSKLEKKKVGFVPVLGNLVDQIWPEAKTEEEVKAALKGEGDLEHGRPPLPRTPIFVQPIEFAGESVSSKLTKLRQAMAADNIYATIVCALDEVAWLYNLRGRDVPYNPVFMSYAIVTQDSATLYVLPEKVSDEVAQHLKEAKVNVRHYDSILEDAAAVGQKVKELSTSEKPLFIWADPAKTNFAVTNALNLDDSYRAQSTPPIAMSKAVKNDAELQGMRECHVRDGVAVCKFFTWLESQLSKLPSAHTSKEEDIAASPLTEYSVTDVLRNFRAEQDKFVDLSFSTISSIGANGAVIHYSPSPTSSKPIVTGKIFLLDSGGQYRDGTTDITRTIFLARPGAQADDGKENEETDAHPSAFQKECFTRVLKGHIALARQIFPKTCTGPALDALARHALWNVGLDYLHGTGHGVGSFLAVHEGPQGIAPNRGPLNGVTLKPGMILSNEPGYYHDGEFGIRIENLVYVTRKATPYQFNKQEFYGFENLTVVPIDRRLIQRDLLTSEEIDYINGYHAQCRAALLPRLKDDEATSQWVIRNTEPL